MQTYKKLTVRVEAGALERAKRYAAEQNVSLSRLISSFLANLDHEPTEQQGSAPILGRVAGVLSADDGVEAHQAYLDAKYGD